MVNVTRRSLHPALPFDEWPPADHASRSAAIRPKGFLKKGGKGADWRPASRRSAIGAYGRWLAWLSGRGTDLGTEPAARRFTAERVEAYAAFLRDGRSSVTATSYLGVLCMAVIAMFPAEEWDWLRIMQKQLRRRATPVRQKQFAPADALFDLGIELIGRADTVLDRVRNPELTPRQVRAAARDFRDGLIIGLLASRPLRIKNLVEMEIGTHLRRTSTQTTIEFAAGETKTHVSICVTWPDALLQPLARYLDEVRPMLIAAPPTGGNVRRPGEPGARLWVGQGGTVFSPGGLTLALERHTERAFGHAMTAHRFRDSVATSIANEDPTKLRYAAQMLGHKRMTTTERHYIARDNATALAGHHDRIKSMRASCCRSRRR